MKQEKYEIVNKAISDFEARCPDNFRKLNNLKNPDGSPVDVIVSLHYYLNKGSNKGASIIEHDASNYFSPVQMILNPRTCSERDDIGRTFAHEGGHIYYEVTNPTEYSKWLNENKIVPGNGYNGHNPGDPSGKMADEWQDAY